jgi:hypothetical protein
VVAVSVNPRDREAFDRIDDLVGWRDRP